MKRKWLWINLAVALFLVCLSVLCTLLVMQWKTSREENRKYTLDFNKVSEVGFISCENGDKDYSPFVTSDKAELEVLERCIKEAKRNYDSVNKQVLTPPVQYTFSITTEDPANKFITETYVYRVYKFDDLKDPFDEFFSLPSVAEKMNGSN